MIVVKENQKILIQETVNSVKQIDDNLWIMNYKCAYGLDALLNHGAKGLIDAVKFLQKEVKFPHVTINPDKDGFACSTFNAKNPDGDYIMGRNFDYKEAPCLVCWTAPENGYKSVSVVDTMFFLHGTKIFPMAKAKSHLRSIIAPYASMDGINEKGFSIAVLQVRATPTKQNTGKKAAITTVLIRAALDKCATVEEGIKLFASYDMQDLLGVNYHYQLADAQGNSAIIEYIDNKMVVIRQEEGKENLMVTNYFLSPGGDNTKGKGYDRYEKIETTLKAKNGVIAEEDAMKLLSEVALNYRHKTLKHKVVALWSAVYNCNEKSVNLCVNMDYSKEYKFYVDKPYEVIKVK